MFWKVKHCKGHPQPLHARSEFCFAQELQIRPRTASPKMGLERAVRTRFCMVSLNLDCWTPEAVVSATSPEPWWQEHLACQLY